MTFSCRTTEKPATGLSDAELATLCDVFVGYSVLLSAEDCTVFHRRGRGRGAYADVVSLSNEAARLIIASAKPKARRR